MGDLLDKDMRVAFRVVWKGAGDPKLSEVVFSDLGCFHAARFLSAEAADAGLCPGLGVYVRELAKAVRSRKEVLPLRRRFLKRFDGLTLEDFRVKDLGEGAIELTFKITQGGAAELFGQENAKLISDSLGDVFLPLTNLSAYLRALSDTKGDTASYAMEQTADRIEEFLLAYGHRLQGGAQVVRLTA